MLLGADSSLRIKVLLTVFLVVVVIEGGFGLYGYFSLRHAQERAIERDIEIISADLVESLREPLYNFNMDAVRRILDLTLRRHEDVVLIAIRQENVPPDAEKIGRKKGEQGELMNCDPPQPGEYDRVVQRRVMWEEKTAIGDVILAFSEEGKRRQLRAMIEERILTVGSLILALIVALSLAFDRLFVRPIRRAAEIAGHVATGDLTLRFEATSEDELGRLGKALDRMVEDLHDLAFDLGKLADLVAGRAEEIADASVSLSSGATEQASSLEEITSALSDVSHQSRENVRRVGEAEKLSQDAKAMAEEGNARIRGMSQAMNSIALASQNIAKINKTIDDIAFQTNLLAVNAAVEAAHAGVYGRGFAVVADEVRGLAARSVEAARETSAIIEEILERIASGTAAVEANEKAFVAIAESIQRISLLVANIADASRSQASSITEIDSSLGQISQVTQQNAANAEESAAASAELARQAQELRRLIARFKVTRNSSFSTWSPPSSDLPTPPVQLDRVPQGSIMPTEPQIAKEGEKSLSGAWRSLP